MFLQCESIFLISMRKLNLRPKLSLFPKDGHASSQANMRKQIIMTDKNLLCFHKIGAITICIYPSRIEPRASHMFTPSANLTEIKGEIVILAVYFLHMPLNDGYSPAHG